MQISVATSSSQMQQPPPSMAQPPTFFQPQQTFPQQEFQTMPPTQPTVHLDGTNHMPSGPTILMASGREPSVHVGVPVQMMPSGAQIIQVQQHPHGQPVQVVQHITGQYSSFLVKYFISNSFQVKCILTVRLFIRCRMVMLSKVLLLDIQYNCNPILLT